MSLYRIDELFNFEKGSLQSSKCESGKYNFITASAEWKTHKEFTYDCEALVFAAAAAGSLGRTHYVNDKFIASDLCFVLTPKDAENFPIDLKFYHLIFRELRKDIVKNTKAGTSKEAISLGNFAKYKLPYFDIEKQNEIKNRFVEAERTKENLTNELNDQLALVKELRQAYLREAMQGKLATQDPTDEPAELLLERIKAKKEKLVAEKKIKRDKPSPPIKPEEIPFEIPSNWTWCRLGEICEINGGKRVPAGYSLLTKPTPYIYIRVSDMQNGTIIDSDLHYIDEKIYEQIKRYTISKDDIYMTIVGATIGKCGLVPERFHNVNLTENAVKVTPTIIDKNFLYLLLKMPFAQDQFVEKTKKVGVEKMAIFRFKNSVLPLPPLAEQERIVAKLEKLMKFCDELEANIRQGITSADQLLQVALKEALEPKG